jgi:hypothetical protein
MVPNLAILLAAFHSRCFGRAFQISESLRQCVEAAQAKAIEQTKYADLELHPSYGRWTNLACNAGQPRPRVHGWFPQGDEIVRHSALDEALIDIVNHELKHLRSKGLTENIINHSWAYASPQIDSSARTCHLSKIADFHIRDGSTGPGGLWSPGAGRQEGVYASLKRFVEKQKPKGVRLDDLDLLFAVGDVPTAISKPGGPAHVAECTPSGIDADKGACEAADESCGILVFEANKRPVDTFAIALFDDTYSHWASDRETILKSSRRWSDRSDRLRFEGGGAGHRRCLSHQILDDAADQLDIRLYKADCPDEFDKGWCGYDVKEGRTAHNDLCSSKYLLHMPGTSSSYSNRLKYLLACGAVVVVTETEFYEFWYPMLRPYEHFIPAGNLELTGGADLPMIVECLRSHDADAEKIAANAREFVNTHLVADVHERYLAELLPAYASLRQYDLHAFPARFPLFQSVEQRRASLTVLAGDVKRMERTEGTVKNETLGLLLDALYVYDIRATGETADSSGIAMLGSDIPKTTNPTEHVTSLADVLKTQLPRYFFEEI